MCVSTSTGYPSLEVRSVFGVSAFVLFFVFLFVLRDVFLIVLFLSLSSLLHNLFIALLCYIFLLLFSNVYVVACCSCNLWALVSRFFRRNFRPPGWIALLCCALTQYMLTIKF